MKGFLTIGPMIALAIALVGCCPKGREIEVVRLPNETPQAYLERLRAVAADARASTPNVRVGGSAEAGTDAFTLDFVACGESEEIDFWRVKAGTDKASVANLRKAFDGAGGRQVEIRMGNQVVSPAACSDVSLPGKFQVATGFMAPAKLLCAGSGRVYEVDSNGKIVFEKRGCGNVHRAERWGDWVYYSNGDLWRVRHDARCVYEKPELVYRAKDRTGAAVLGFEILKDGKIVLALNGTAEIVVFDLEAKREEIRFKVDCRDAKGVIPPPHGRIRFVRKTVRNTYLVACCSAACVREFDAQGKQLWEQSVPPFVFDCFERANGNVVVTHLTGVTEFTREHNQVWNVTVKELQKQGIDMLCGVQELADGTLVLGSWANGVASGAKACAIAVGRDRRVHWAWYPQADVNLMSARVMP